MEAGNGDPNLCLFGEEVTPNAHAIARQFVLLDNFYVDAEVSYDGHAYSMGATATDVVEKIWPLNYGERGGPYLSEGEGTMRNEHPVAKSITLNIDRFRSASCAVCASR